MLGIFKTSWTTPLFSSPSAHVSLQLNVESFSQTWYFFCISWLFFSDSQMYYLDTDENEHWSVMISIRNCCFWDHIVCGGGCYYLAVLLSPSQPEVQPKPWTFLILENQQCFMSTVWNALFLSSLPTYSKLPLLSPSHSFLLCLSLTF